MQIKANPTLVISNDIIDNNANNNILKIPRSNNTVTHNSHRYNTNDNITKYNNGNNNET